MCACIRACMVVCVPSDVAKPGGLEVLTTSTPAFSQVVHVLSHIFGSTPTFEMYLFMSFISSTECVKN